MISGNQALRIEIDDMRLIPRPAKPWLIEHKHGRVRAIGDYMSPSAELFTEALKELDALKGESPVKQCERRVVEVAGVGR